ncbi:hypothetical protein C9I98_11235 [Photobacterium sanctipauli]|uniref:Uncharacterized protein n=2 Tax=Photobacterium sanctipauli TaxID=1342794 RepID=A0A2T3NU03_9GAMM|nr:hypothetical protein C9I98_11235 [Photobacterium sanctipauli]
MIRDCIRIIIGKRNYIKLRFFITHRYFCNLKNPKTWNEKIQSRKLSSKSIDYAKFVDKYTVREYVGTKIGSEYLIPLIAKFEKIQVSDFASLPNQFVIKTSNGGGGKNVKIIYDKKSEDLAKLTKDFNKYVTNKIGHKIDEYFYDIEKPQILIEELMLDDFGNIPCDYKFHIFNSAESRVIIQIDQGRFTNHRRSLYSENGEILPFNIQPKYGSVNDYTLPASIIPMLNKAKKLAEDFDYVRIDMYSINGNIYFGEMTFCHGSGWEPVSPKCYDKILGSYW